ncbi:NADP-dependent oxidoreductase [Streptomyces griseorubiginosus]|uniref:NADP-dependent oxidoreductase n=1 Tax=Streptomyces griseorubiginosus TaxID=67304 RepID=UPI001AD68F13|nr:NADP-dependent oxidoreductase [Streptomyces griseorubiginosus]MBO4253536.1 zinc-binding dehydrogenase [Streptomyces griseorubiginosus]
MRAVGLEQYGGPDVLRVVDRPLPVPGPGQVRIRVAAAAVNPTDLLLRSGQLAAATAGLEPPYTPGMDASGVVDAVGDGVDLGIGEPVMTFVNPFQAAGGAQAEYVVVPRDQVVAAPRGLDLRDVAGLPMNGLTAHLALSLLDLPQGSTLAVTGAPGALGGYAVQLAKHRGLRVVADATESDRELVRGLGADVVVPRAATPAELVGAYRGALPEGADAVVDAAILGAPALGIVRDGGRLAKCRPYELASERGIIVLSVQVPGHPDKRSALEELAGLAEKGVLTLRTAAVLAPEQAPEAHRRLEAGGVRGRLILAF